jgi:hypothetical protein
MKECENCKLKHEGIYGSGRFCSNTCAKGFSTKFKRLEINEKVKIKLTTTETIIKECENLKCKKKFKYNSTYKNRKYCSIKCGAFVNSTNEIVKDKLSIARINAIKRGITNGSGIKSTYLFKGNFINCDSNIERACINYFENLGASLIERCDITIQYVHNGTTRRFLPDFKVLLNNKTYIVEAKGYVTSTILNEKWRHYNETSILKKNILQQYCKENNYDSFWFTKDLHMKYYRNLSRFDS